MICNYLLEPRTPPMIICYLDMLCCQDDVFTVRLAARHRRSWLWCGSLLLCRCQVNIMAAHLAHTIHCWLVTRHGAGLDIKYFLTK